MYLLKLSMWIALGIAALVACGQQEPTTQKEALPLAEVGTEVITDRELRYLIDNVAEWAKSEQEGSAKVREYLQSLVDRTLILREARAGKLDRSPAFVSEVATALRRRLIREIEQRAVEEQVAITEEEMRRVFAEQNWARWIKIAHIVVPTQERAEEALAALRAGTPFEEVAREFSTHSRTAGGRRWAGGRPDHPANLRPHLLRAFQSLPGGGCQPVHAGILRRGRSAFARRRPIRTVGANVRGR